eukprot:7447583-Ditylum_brightwellii.AAC.1
MLILIRNVFTHFANHEAKPSLMYSIIIPPPSVPCGAISFLIIPLLSRHYYNLLGSIAMDRHIPQSAFVSRWDYKVSPSKNKN